MKPTIQTERYTLYLGDCLAVLPHLARVDAVITDPPFGIALSNHSFGKERSARTFTILGDESQEVGIVVAKWCEVEMLPTLFFASPRLPWSGKWRNYLIWDKGGAVGGGGDTATCWKQTWELIQIARNRPLNGPRDGSVLKFFITPADMLLHPTQKPVRLMKYLVEKLTQPGDTIFDPFMGSGTTGVACIQTGRKFIGIEMDERYFEIAAKRLEAAAAQGQLFDKPQAAPTCDALQLAFG